MVCRMRDIHGAASRLCRCGVSVCCMQSHKQRAGTQLAQGQEGTRAETMMCNLVFEIVHSTTSSAWNDANRLCSRS